MKILNNFIYKSTTDHYSYIYIFHRLLINVAYKLHTWRMVSSGMLRPVALVRTDVSEEFSASFIRVTRIGELGTTLAVTSNRRTLRRNTKSYKLHTWLSLSLGRWSDKRLCSTVKMETPSSSKPLATFNQQITWHHIRTYCHDLLVVWLFNSSSAHSTRSSISNPLRVRCRGNVTTGEPLVCLINKYKYKIN
jgi:hypothetical protein